jgi:ferredoxin
MTLEIRIDRSACRGAKSCVRRAPKTFALDSEGRSSAAAVPGDGEAAIRDAAAACPHFAITVRERGGKKAP